MPCVRAHAFLRIRSRRFGATIVFAPMPTSAPGPRWLAPSHICPATALTPSHICAGNGLASVHICPATALTPSHICPGWLAPSHICPATALTPSHICTGTGLTPSQICAGIDGQAAGISCKVVLGVDGIAWAADGCVFITRRVPREYPASTRRVPREYPASTL